MFSSPPLPNQATLTKVTKDELSNCSSANKVSLLVTINEIVTLNDLINCLKFFILGFCKVICELLTKEKHCVCNDNENNCKMILGSIVYVASMRSI